MLMFTGTNTTYMYHIYYSPMRRQYTLGPMCESKARIDGKVVIVTGANTGIGKETVVDLLNRGATSFSC